MLTILTGDAIEQLRTLPTESVQCCVTSPPYWGLRDYGTAAWEGGDKGCDHIKAFQNNKPSETLHRGIKQVPIPFNGDCVKCGASRIDSQLGLERTPEEYVAKIVAVFREVRRVLRQDGTLWLNLGSSYSSGGGDTQCAPTLRTANHDAASGKQEYLQNFAVRPGNVKGYKPKDMIPIPWLVAMALQADGWWLRSDIIWSKPNQMPESVTDRPTKSHEYLFLLTKASSYFYDSEAIKERAETVEDRPFGVIRDREWGYDSKEAQLRGRKPHPKYSGSAGTSWNGHSGNLKSDGTPISNGSRNKRSVWTVATAPYPEAHFATYPPDLIKPCIMAGSRVGDTMLDPFAGSGTSGMVALELGRKAVLIELNPKYCDLIRQRCDVTPGLQLA